MVRDAEDAFDDGENDGSGADSECEREHSGKSESGDLRNRRRACVDRE
jgi:hypothetical protein